jgi:hypothetical protein
VPGLLELVDAPDSTVVTQRPRDFGELIDEMTVLGCTAERSEPALAVTANVDVILRR